MSDNSCAKCGACTSVCPVYQVTGQEALTARGRLHLLAEIAPGTHSQTYLDIFSKCLLCDACRQVCPRDINLPAKVAESRRTSPRRSGQGSFAQLLVKGCLSQPSILATIGKLLKISAPLLDKIPMESGLRLKLGLPASTDYQMVITEPFFNGQTSREVLPEPMIFSGCFARYLSTDITGSATRLIYDTGNHQPALPAKQTCCGLAFYSSGGVEKARHLARLNIAAFAENDAPIIVLCGSCFGHLANYPDLLADDEEWHLKAVLFVDRLRELSSFLEGNSLFPDVLPSGLKETPKQRVLYHDPCHLRYKPGMGEKARRLLRKLPWIELVELPEGPQCCGFGGLFNLAHPDISGQIGENLVNAITAVDPDLLVTTCSGCLIQLRQQMVSVNSRCKVLHLTQLLTAQAGISTHPSQASF